MGSGTRGMCHRMGSKAADSGCRYFQRQSGAVQLGSLSEGADHGQAHARCAVCCMEHYRNPGNGRLRQAGESLAHYMPAFHSEDAVAIASLFLLPSPQQIGRSHG